MIGGLWKSTGSLAMLAAAGLFVGGVPSAKAADLGGDCCADLEERVAELEATTARKGNRRVSLTISGQVSTMLMAWSDGNPTDGSDTYVVDNVMAGGTFFALSGSARINPNMTAGFNITLAFETGARSHQVSAADDDATTSTDIQPTLTLANWYLDHKAFGRVTVGRINTATAGITTIDLGGAGVIANASFGYTQRGFLLTEGGVNWSNWSGLMGGNDVNGASLSRANAISYTSPTMGGFSVAAAWGEDDIWDVALRYAGEFSGFRVAAGIGYINNSSGLNEITKDHLAGAEPNIWKGSASVLHVASGLYLTGAYLNKDWDNAARPDTTLWYVQGGIAKNWTGLGNTVVYGEYGRVDDGLTGTNFFGGLVLASEATMWGLGIVQHIDAAAMEVFLSYKRFSGELTDNAGGVHTHNFNDFDVVLGGARIRF